MSRYVIVDAPFGARPYLWISAEMLVTPGTRKSQSGMSSPRSSSQGSTKPPTHASTWNGIFLRTAMRAISSIGSITPCRVLRCRCGDEHGVPIDERLEVAHVASHVAAHARVADLEAEVRRRLVERDVDGLGHDEVRFRDLLVLAARAITRRLTLMSTDSVPPLVIVPTVSGPTWSIDAVMRTTSASIRRRLGNVIGLSAFSAK